MKTITITLTDTQEKGLELYTENKKLDTLEEGLTELVDRTAESQIRAAFQEKVQDKTLEEMAAEIATE